MSAGHGVLANRQPRGRVERCAVSGKIQYRTRRKALRRNSERTISSQAYLCQHCGLWHVTRRQAA